MDPSSLSPSASLDLSKEYPEIFIPVSWSEAANSLAFNSSSPVVVVVGPKNSGKTTFSRYLVNVLLQRYKDVWYLDTDVGQSEFTPPGCLSLHVLQEHITDFKVMSLKTPVKCCFFGDLSSKRDPRAYLDGVFSLYDYFRKENYRSNDLDCKQKPAVPLVINTPGWVKGTGYDILVEILRYITCTHVVNIRTSAHSKNLPRGSFWLSGDHEAEASLVELKAVQKDSNNKSILLQKHVHDLREIRIIAYFNQCVRKDMEISTYRELALVLASIPPYEVNISDIQIKHLHCQVPSSETFHSLNATMVGLAISTETTDRGTPWCVGLGIVRGIDISKDLIYVITPVPTRILEKVDLLLQGFIQIPSCLLQIRGCVSPYMSANVLNKLNPLSRSDVRT